MYTLYSTMCTVLYTTIVPSGELSNCSGLWSALQSLYLAPSRGRETRLLSMFRVDLRYLFLNSPRIHMLVS